MRFDIPALAPVQDFQCNNLKLCYYPIPIANNGLAITGCFNTTPQLYKAALNSFQESFMSWIMCCVRLGGSIETGIRNKSTLFLQGSLNYNIPNIKPRYRYNKLFLYFMWINTMDKHLLDWFYCGVGGLQW